MTQWLVPLQTYAMPRRSVLLLLQHYLKGKVQTKKALAQNDSLERVNDFVLCSPVSSLSSSSNPAF